MSNYSELVKTLYNNYNAGEKYKIDTTKYNKIDINIIIATILNEFNTCIKFKNRPSHLLVPTYKNKKYFVPNFLENFIIVTNFVIILTLG
jgi:hypothetical protein